MAAADSDAHPHTPPPTYQHGSTLTRRRALQVLGASIAAGAGSSTVKADDDNGDDDDQEHDFDGPSVGAGDGPSLIGRGNVMSTLVAGVFDGFRGSSTAQGKGLWDQIFADALEMEKLTNAAVGSIENDAEMLDAYLRTDIAHEIVTKSPDDDYGLEDVEQAAMDVLDDAVSNIITNLCSVWAVNWLAFIRRINWVLQDDTGDIDVNNIFRTRTYLWDDDDEEVYYKSAGYFDTSTGVGLDNEETLEDLLDHYQSFDDDYDDGLDSQYLEYDGLDDDANPPTISPLFHDIDEDVEMGAMEIELPNGDKIHIPCWYQERFYMLEFLIPVNLERLDDFDVHDDRDHFDVPDTTGVLDMWELDIETWADTAEGHDSQHDGMHGEIMTFQRVGDEGVDGEIRATHIDPKPFLQAHEKIYQTYIHFSGEIANLASALYEPARDGEISADEITSGTALLEVAQDGDDWQKGAAYFRSGNLAEGEEYISLETPQLEANGTLFVTDRGGVEMETGEWLYPEDYDMGIHFSGEVTETVDPPLVDYEITVVDDDDEPIEDAEVDVVDEDWNSLTDSDGTVVFDDLPVQAHDLEIYHDGETTKVTQEVDTEDFPTIEHDGEDRTYDSDVGQSDQEVGDVITSELTGPFRIETEDGSDYLEFPESELYDPDDPEDVTRVLGSAYEQEQESRDGDTEVTVESDVVLPGWPDNPLEDPEAMLGLGIIAVVGVAIVGFVTDLLPWT